MARILNDEGYRRVRMAAVVEAVNRRGWKWRKETRDDGRPMLLLQSPGGRRWHFKLNAGAWVKESSAVEAQKEAA